MRSPNLKMAATGKIEILVGAQTAEAAAKLNQFASSSHSALQKLADGLRIGLGIDLAQRFISKLQEIPNVLERMTQRGIAFNRTLEDSQLGIAAVLKQFDERGKFKNFEEAMVTAGEALEALKKKAKESPATFQQLVSAFQANAGAAAAANIPLQRQVDLTVLMSQALAGLGIRSEQIIQESRALLTGNINEDAQAARILGITRAQIEAAKEQGRLFEFLTGRLSAFAEAGSAAAGTFTVRLSNLGDSLDQTLGKLTRPIFDTLRESFDRLTKVIESPAFEEQLEGLANRINDVVRAGMRLAEFAARHAQAIADALILIAIAATAATVALTAFGARATIAALAGIAEKLTVLSVLGASGLVSLKAVLTSLPGAIAVAGSAFAGWEIGRMIDQWEVFGLRIGAWVQLAYLEMFGGWERIKAYLAGSFTWIVDTMGVMWQRLVILTQKGVIQVAEMWNKLPMMPEFNTGSMRTSLLGQEMELERLMKERDARLAAAVAESAQKRDAALAGIDAAAFEIGVKNPYAKSKGSSGASSSQGGKMAATSAEGQQILDEINRLYREATMDRIAILNLEEVEARAKIDREVADFTTKEFAKVQLAQIYANKREGIYEEEEEARLKAMEEALAKQRQMEERALRDKMQLAADELRAERERVALDRATLDADFNTPEFAKKSKRVSLLEQEIQLIDRVIVKLKELRDAQTDEAAKASIDQQVRGFESERMGLQTQRVGMAGAPDPFSWADQFSAKLTDLQNQWGTWATQAATMFADVFNSAISTISSGITGLIMGTKTWAQALQQIGMTILESIIGAFVQMGVRWIATQIMMAVAAKAIQASMLAASAPLALASSAIWATPATLATIASYGAAAAAAPGFIAMAQGITMAQSLAAFAEGGIIRGPGGPKSDSVIVRGSPGEAITKASAVGFWGEGFMAAINQGAAGARNVQAMVMAGMARPVTSDPDALARMPGLTGGGGGGGSEINVSPAPVQVAILNDRQQVLDVLASSAGKAVIVGAVDEAKLRLGIGT